MDMKQAIQRVADRQDLTGEEAGEVMELLLTGAATQAQIGAFLTGLRMKGETIDEIAGLASVLADKAEHIHPHSDHYIDLVGTGGDCTYSFNISTTSAIVTAAAGVSVAKHGNRSISSKSGAGDVLEQLGVNIMMEPEKVEACVDEVGIGFMFAQTFNKSMRFVGQARSEMGIRTVFNILGPLTNPATPNMQLLGVYDESLVEPLARVLTSLGVKRGMVVYGTDKLDEISASSPTLICEFKDGEYQTYTITPEEFGMKTCKKDDLLGGTPAENAEITRAILKGEDKGPRRNAVLLNAGAALYIGDRAESFADGIRLAGELIDSGKALETLEAFIKESNS